MDNSVGKAPCESCEVWIARYVTNSQSGVTQNGSFLRKNHVLSEQQRDPLWMSMHSHQTMTSEEPKFHTLSQEQLSLAHAMT